VKASALAKYMGFAPDDIAQMINEDALAAAEIVADEFRRVLASLAQDVQAGELDRYEVVIETEPYRLNKGSLGPLKLIRYHIYVQSPDSKINVFDLIDSGRKALPKRGFGQSPYPLWNVEPGQSSNVVAPVGSAYRRKGKYSISKPRTGGTGLRPEKMRWQLYHRPSQPDATYLPTMFVRGPIKAVPGKNLYKRIYANAKKKLRAKGFTMYELIVTGRKGVEYGG
jgi:hypothetical protein